MQQNMQPMVGLQAQEERPAEPSPTEEVAMEAAMSALISGLGLPHAVQHAVELGHHAAKLADENRSAGAVNAAESVNLDPGALRPDDALRPGAPRR